MHKGNNIKAIELLKGVVQEARDFFSAHNALCTL
jgi:hypothetical protein